jgi:cardiolipin synthase
VRQLPNLITLARFALVVPVGVAVLAGDHVLALGLFVLAGASDGLDGALARRFDWQTRFGAVADPLADKLLVAVVYVTLAAEGVLPVWLAALVLGRDAVIVGGALGYHLLVERLEMAPTVLGKVNTLANLLFVGFVLASRVDDLAFLEPVVVPGGWGIAVLTLVSGLDYVRTWSTRAAHRREGEA